MFKRTDKEHFLLEIGAEELPPKGLRQLANGLHDNLCEGIRAAGLSFVSSQLYATPRRIAVLLKNLDPIQSEQLIEKRGPALNAAYDKEGKPTKAAEGFAQSCGVTVDALSKLETDKGSWLVYRSVAPGKTIAEIMPEIITTAIKNIPAVGKNMRWGSKDVEFSRPVHWLVAMYGKNVLNVAAFDCQASNITYGHRFLAPAAIKIKSPEKYAQQLQKQGKVIADFKQRRDTIRHQIFEACEALNAQPLLDEDLLDEVTNIVEWPVALVAKFDPAFLSVPPAALIAAMQNHQKCFALTDHHGELLPMFITISNISSKDPARVISGNEKVMRARLSDAKFFYDTDLKHKLADRVPELKTITFEEKLGSLYDRVERITEVSTWIAKQLNADVKQVQRAALLCKADLVTAMVGEFPELQGIMGYYYAKQEGESTEVALAIRDHYKPKSAADTASKDPLAYIVGIADKLDLLVGIFGIGNLPTGDKDPYGLRRAALGIIRTLAENNLPLDLAELVRTSQETYGKKLSNKDVLRDVMQFIYERLRVWYKDQGVNNYVFNAVMAKEPTSLLDFNKRVQAVISFRKLVEARSLSEANKRVVNILTKNADQVASGQVQKQYLQEPAEIELAQALADKFPVISEYYKEHRYNEILRSLADLKQPIDDFFEKVMVMADDADLRRNRLLLLKQLQTLLNMVADISLLQ